MHTEIEKLIPNIICEPREFDGKVKAYRISPAKGYKLHETHLDEPIFDKGTGEETNKIKLGYTRYCVTVRANYDWETNPKQIYAVPIDTEEEIIEKEEVVENEEIDTLTEKAKAYDILMGADTDESY